MDDETRRMSHELMRALEVWLSEHGEPAVDDDPSDDGAGDERISAETAASEAA